jgi:hypothetical protein
MKFKNQSSPRNPWMQKKNNNNNNNTSFETRHLSQGQEEEAMLVITH